MVAKAAKQISTGFIAAGCLMVAPSASAHHSYAMFDRTRTINIEGNIRRYDWTNPHVYIWINVTNTQGGTDLWAIEAGPPSRLDHIGWTRHSFEVGDHVKVELNPLRDGRTGGYFFKAVKADGGVLMDHTDRGGGDTTE